MGKERGETQNLKERKEDVQSTLVKTEHGDWSITLDTEGKSLLSEMLKDLRSDWSDCSPTLLLIETNSYQSSEKSSFTFKIYEGPDIHGTDEEIRQLNVWQPKEKKE